MEKPTNKREEYSKNLIMNIKPHIMMINFLAIKGAFLYESQAHEERNGVCYKRSSQLCIDTIFDSFCWHNPTPLSNGCCVWLSSIGYDCFTNDMVKEAKAKHICDKEDVQERANNLWLACLDPYSFYPSRLSFMNN